MPDLPLIERLDALDVAQKPSDMNVPGYDFHALRGFDPTRYKIVAFATGACFAGLAGGLYAHFKQFIHPEAFGFMRSIDIVVMVILGGMGSMVGVCAAAALLTILPELLRALANLEGLPAPVRDFVSNRMILYSVLLIILMIARPQGLLNFAGHRARASR